MARTHSCDCSLSSFLERGRILTATEMLLDVASAIAGILLGLEIFKTLFMAMKDASRNLWKPFTSTAALIKDHFASYVSAFDFTSTRLKYAYQRPPGKLAALSHTRNKMKWKWKRYPNNPCFVIVWQLTHMKQIYNRALLQQIEKSYDQNWCHLWLETVLFCSHSC